MKYGGIRRLKKTVPDLTLDKQILNDPRIWATGGRLQQVWEEALPSNRTRAKAAAEALDGRLAEINENRP